MNLINTEKAYIAGILDGDGSICVSRSQIGVFVLCVSIANTDKELMIWLADKIECKFCEAKSLKMPMWHLRIHGVRAKELLPHLLPYLIVKKEQAQLALEFPVHKRWKNNKRPDEERLKQALIYDKMKKMNHLCKIVEERR